MTHKKSDVTVYVTMDYDIFEQNKKQPINRITDSLVLKESLEFTGGNHLKPIVINENNMQIIDGHRTLHASRQARTPVYYILISTKEADKIMKLLNMSGKTWSTAQFINHYAHNDKNYKILEKFMKTQGATIEMIKNFSPATQSGLRSGMDIKSLDYILLEKVRKIAIYISGVFDLRITTVHRAIRDLRNSIGDLDIDRLEENIMRDRRNGKYEKIEFVTSVSKLTTALSATYARK